MFLRFDDGFFDYYDVTVPFNGVEQPNMHGVLVLAIFGFCLLLAQFVAARRPLPAVLTVIAGAGWPATLYPVESVFYGALILAAALWVLAGLRTARPLPALVAGAVLVLAAAGASTSAALAKDGVLAWERWDPNATSRQVSVSYVWDASYGGIEFPKEKTTVLRIVGPTRGLYWRATTLDQFTADRWIEDPTPLSTGLARGRLPSDPLLPARSLNRRTWVKQQVEVVALRDAHIVAATQPVALEAPQLGGVFNLSDGIVRVYGGLKRGQRYTAYSYAPRPEPAQLARVEPAYPAALDRFLQIGRTRVEPFGADGRDARVDALFGDERYLALWPYESALERGTAAPGGRADALRGGRGDRDLASRDRRLRLRRVAAADRRPAAARALRRPRASAATASTSPARWPSCSASSGSPRASPRVHERQARGRRLDRHRPQRARLGRGLVPGLRLARLRPDARARRSRRHLQRVVGRIQRR